MAAPPDPREELLPPAGPGSQGLGDREEGEDEAVTPKGARPAPQAGESGREPGAGAGGAAPRELGSSNPARPLPVAMETASTGVADVSRAMDHPFSTASKDGEGACYTSLISDICYPPQEDSTYFTGILQKENGHVTTSESPEELSTLGPSLPDVPGTEPRGLFSSDSGIEMTPAESTEVNKILEDPLDQMKAEAYKYIDITRPEEVSSQEQHHPKLEEKDFDFKNNTEISIKSEKAPEPEKPAPVEGKILKDHLFEESTFAPYIDDLSEEYHRASLVTAPIKITLTEIESSVETATQEKSPEKQDICLKPSPDTVPTVTVSEPEDDSPESITPPSLGTEPSAAESQGKGSLSEDELVTAIKEAKGLSYETSESPQSAGPVADRPEVQARSARPTIPSPLDHEASSAESGDSEIELVSEDPLAAEDALASGYVTFGHVGGPPPSPASPSIQYSILREEREAELDSELILESCDASSASEESPKREQDSPPMKPGALDAIREECAPSQPGLAEQGPFLRFPSAAPQAGPELPPGDGAPAPEEEPAGPQKPAEAAASSKETPAPSGSPGPRGPGFAPPLLFFNKQKAIDLLYWRDIKQTGIVFGSFLLLLFSLTQFSVVSVVAYLALAVLSATISFRIYKSVLQAVQKTDEGHPFKAYLELEITLSQEQIQKYTDCLQFYVNNTLKELRRLFLVQDLVDSLKFAVLMWLLTYVGALFNGLTLLLMAVVSMFTLPVVYVKHQAQVDQYLGLVRTHINAIVAKIQAKIPGAKRHAE
ncbi:reticulon-1 isoform X1 [Pipistrellus kuhlii]|uniref:Reticulon n=2 Tax=Pipistrellus kuhlii TaxID=59472 RepID=A0A7J8B441_PIPKU|nr:reticulon-1 isoform X1 [Pipistrellus kuhlii]KAF6393587.1 reticulon 1 [Pipistrellus kuhlii]